MPYTSWSVRTEHNLLQVSNQSWQKTSRTSVKLLFLYKKEAHPTTHIPICKEHGRFCLYLGDGSLDLLDTGPPRTPQIALGTCKTGLKKDSFSQLWPALPDARALLSSSCSYTTHCGRTNCTIKKDDMHTD